MDRDVVEVVARFGGTILDVAHVGEADTYRIGSAQGTNLAVPGLVCFPLVTGTKLRFPVGVPAVEHDGWTELRFGALTIHLTRTKLSRAPLARPRFERRTSVFLAASLVVHLALWLLALASAPYEKLPRQRAVLRLAHMTSAPEPTVKPKPVKPPERIAGKHASAAAMQPARPRRVATDDEPHFHTAAEATAALAASFDKIDVVGKLADLRPEDTYNEDEANARGFGGSKRFDPNEREGFESVKSGNYSTMIYDVKLCPNKSCTVVGPVPALFVRTHLLAHMDEIYDCYVQHATEPGTIVLSFTITPDGSVHDASGSGLGETGPCAARVAGEIYFKALGNDFHPPRSTRVAKYPVRFNPSRD
jgi:hypothetical protein